jgi:DsbC/DsbD-like thiol-disulfide interchange protein
MKRKFLPTIVFLAFTAFVAASANAQTVSGSIANGKVERGKQASGSIVLSIPGGLHVNSNRPASDYAIPTVVTLSANGARVSRVTYPRGKNRRFQFSENLINVYEGRVRFPFTITVPAGYKGTTVRVNVSVRYQACTEEVCYPPKTKNVTLTAKVL